MEPRIVADYGCVCGENPLWHPTERRLYWTDIDTGRLFRYDPSTGAHECFYEGAPVGGFTIQADGGLLLFMERGAVKIWKDGVVTTVLEEIPQERASRFNDVIADPRGRVFCGTMPTSERLGRLYRLDTDGSLALLLEDVRCSNGMGFTLDRKGLYFTDSEEYTIFLFDYDEETGALSNRRVFYQNPESEGLPDGMTVDAEGYLWSACWDGWSLLRIAPDGSVVRRIRFPAKQVSSVIFGGEDYSEAYVTTAGGEDKIANGPGAGALYRLCLGVRGLPEFPSRVGL